MKSSDERGDVSRRAFMLAGGELLTAAWLMAQWPAIAAAAHHSATAAAGPVSERWQFFTAEDAADVAAVCEQILPSGETGGAREAHAVIFIDRSLASFFSPLARGYREGLGTFQTKFSGGRAGKSYAAASNEEQLAFLASVDETPFFESTRMLTVLGTLASPSYGGNFQGSGWKMLGFVDQHAFAPPFGYYDRDYAGFIPYPAKA
jgi:gluconate 2-dehydrogenase gamma chain